jgi:hypothetical protein
MNEIAALRAARPLPACCGPAPSQTDRKSAAKASLRTRSAADREAFLGLNLKAGNPCGSPASIRRDLKRVTIS